MKLVSPCFTPYFDKKLGGWIKSREQEQRAFGKYGVSPIDDHHAMRREAKQIHKYREDIIQAEYAKIGVKYKPGSNVTFDEKNGRFIPRRA